MTTILIADDHVLVREALKLLLSMQPGWQVVGETGDGAAVEQLVRDTKPDLVLLDLDMPNFHGEIVAAHIRHQFPDTKILVLTGELHPEVVRRALSAGADGYVIKHEDSTELLQAIETVLAEGQYISKRIAAQLASLGEMDGAISIDDTVTPREQEIMCMIASGMSNEEIADALSRSVLTIRKHRQNLMDKLGLRNAAEVTAYAIKRGFYRPA